MEPLCVRQEDLERLLLEAERAHAEYERSVGQRDENWAAWYARYILQRLPQEHEPSAAPYISG